MKSLHSAAGAVGLSLAIAALTTLMTGTASAASCTIGFGNSTGLGLLWNGVTSGVPTVVGQPGGFMEPDCTRVSPNWTCQETVDDQLWYYEQCSFGDWFYMDEAPNTSYGHFHLPTDDPTLDTCLGQSSGVWTMGKGTSSCVLDTNTTSLSRNIISHQPDEWMRIVNRSNSARLFIPSSILLKAASANVKVAFVDTNGTFWQWSLAAQGRDFTWNLPPTGTFGATAYVGTLSASSSGNEMNFDNLGYNTQL